MSDLPRIHTDEDWLDLRLDEQGLLIGQLDCSTTPDSAAILVVTPGWEMFAVNVGRAPVHALPTGTNVHVTVTRTEDGIDLAELKEVIA